LMENVFVAAYKYPIYGVQWHPEKNSFEWKNSSGIPHSSSAIRAAHYIADFFINEGKSIVCKCESSTSYCFLKSLLCNLYRLITSKGY